MKNRSYFLLLLSIILLPLPAWSASFLVKNVKKEKNLLIVTGLSEAEGSKLTVSVGGQDCVAQVNKVKGPNTLLQLDFNCNLASVEKGNSLSYTKELNPDSKLDNLVISRVEAKKHLIYANIPPSLTVNVGSEFTIFSPDRNYCIIAVVSISKNIAALNTRKCSFEYEIRVGMPLEARSNISKRGRTGQGSVGLDSMYFLFGAGYPTITYSNAQDKSTTDTLKSDSSVSNFRFALDLLGVYFPISNGLILCGGLAHVVRDGYSGGSTKYEIYQIQAGTSFLFFFNKQRFGKGLFLRADAGMARYTATAVTNSEEGGVSNTPAKNGWGAMAGGGWSFNATDSVMMMGQVLYAYRSMGDSKISTITAVLGLMF
ncbi:MAG: hypothetical protein HYV97_09290 [Bdellovibrio sp.]|nr:hypothetical protein [Bdellovibrio sp.]